MNAIAAATSHFTGQDSWLLIPSLISRGFPSQSPTRNTVGVIEFVRNLEEVLIRTCAEFGIATRRISGLTGVWTSPPPALSSRAEQDDSLANHPAQSRDLLLAEAKIAALWVFTSRAVSHRMASP